MTPEEALKHFKSAYDLCKQLGIHQSNFKTWKDEGWLPLRQQILINRVTGANMPIDLDKKELAERLAKEKEKE